MFGSTRIVSNIALRLRENLSVSFSDHDLASISIEPSLTDLLLCSFVVWRCGISTLVAVLEERFQITSVSSTLFSTFTGLVDPKLITLCVSLVLITSMSRISANENSFPFVNCLPSTWLEMIWWVLYYFLSLVTSFCTFHVLGFVLAELIPDKIDYTKIADGNVMKFSCFTGTSKHHFSWLELVLTD